MCHRATQPTPITTEPSSQLASLQAAQPRKKKKDIHGKLRSSPFKTRNKTERPQAPEARGKAMKTQGLWGQAEKGV